jgi:hypothetical protein
MTRLGKGLVAVGPGPWVDLGEAGCIGIVHIWCDGATAAATVQVESANDPNYGEPGAPALLYGQGGTPAPAIVNPSATGTFQAVIGRFVRMTVTAWTSGSLNGSATVKPD